VALVLCCQLLHLPWTGALAGGRLGVAGTDARRGLLCAHLPVAWCAILRRSIFKTGGCAAGRVTGTAARPCGAWRCLQSGKTALAGGGLRAPSPPLAAALPPPTSSAYKVRATRRRWITFALKRVAATSVLCNFLPLLPLCCVAYAKPEDTAAAAWLALGRTFFFFLLHGHF